MIVFELVDFTADIVGVNIKQIMIESRYQKI